MSEREQLLRAVLAEPEEDLPRLVFADWLDENGEGDLDRATVEFIRVSCSRSTKPGASMPRAAYPWIEANWQRLLPTLFKAYPMRPKGENITPADFWTGWHRDGRVISTHWWDGTRNTRDKRNFYRLYLSFSRGFVVEVTRWALSIELGVIPLIAADQPAIAATESRRSNLRGRTARDHQPGGAPCPA